MHTPIWSDHHLAEFNRLGRLGFNGSIDEQMMATECIVIAEYFEREDRWRLEIQTPRGRLELTVPSRELQTIDQTLLIDESRDDEFPF